MIPNRRPLLIVSLPRNDVTLAVAAKESGAHVLKVHVNVRHLASGTVFGSLSQERPQLEKILALGLPTGLVPGEEQMIEPEEISEIRRMGFAFLDAFIDTIRAYFYEAEIPIIPALPHTSDETYVSRARGLPGEWIEAAIVPSAGYGRSPEPTDFDALRGVGKSTGKHLIVPTQRRVVPADVPKYFEIPQVRALMIGAIVTGVTPSGVAAATTAFRHAIDRIPASE
ncbi:MAG: hypothetical protein ACRDFA_04180 [bacterium]